MKASIMPEGLPHRVVEAVRTARASGAVADLIHAIDVAAEAQVLQPAGLVGMASALWGTKRDPLFLSEFWSCIRKLWEADKDDDALALTAVYREIMAGFGWEDAVRATDLGRLIYCECRAGPTMLAVQAIEIMTVKVPDLLWWTKAFSFFYNHSSAAAITALLGEDGAEAAIPQARAAALLLYSFGMLDRGARAFERADLSASPPLQRVAEECRTAAGLADRLRAALAAPPSVAAPPRSPDAAPFVVIHRGNPHYLDCCLQQCMAVNDGNVVLLGDETNAGKAAVRHHDLGRFMAEADAFAAIYRHQATSPLAYELFCFQRWFVLDAFMQQTGTERCVLIDSDVLPFCSTEAILAELRGGTGMSNWAWTCPIGRRDALSAFVASLTELYSRPEPDVLDYLQRYGRAVGATPKRSFQDMHALYAFEIRNPGVATNFFTAAGTHGFDVNIIVPEAFETADFSFASRLLTGRPFKRTDWVDGVPVGTIAASGTRVPMKTLHFQGLAKQFMPVFLDRARSGRP